MTKVDVSPQIRNKKENAIDKNNFYTDPRVIDCCRKLRALGVNTVIPIMNYVGNTNLNDKIDYVALTILQKAIDLAQ